ncbi:exodeoxyribonuclease III [Porticoccaceae bacterium]|nr:exodeoxyribonuclease III [Porticoccaceae bacterium]MDB9843324.1 exodeoxyribonuclease III [Porticoccaceae bacterium]MDC0133685.1 exodeoxyribonuclease III [Porticoccaceae bacterium]CAI8363850.1 MAG: Exodeoxyribonuclease III [SAR92 bacterium MED-G29]
MKCKATKIISFNVNGLRARLHQLQAVIDQHDPDIIGLQETKVSNDDFPMEAVKAMGYEVDIHGQKGHYGVAMLSKIAATNITRGYPTDDEDAQRRMIHGEYCIGGQTIHVINGYFPQGEGRAHPTKFPAKQKFYKDLLIYLQDNFSAKDRVVVMGDMNVAAEDIDIGIKPENAKRWLKTGKCAFLPEEREWLQNLRDWGLQDSYRSMNAEDTRSYSWFDYRSRGFEQEPKSGLRIDLILASNAAMAGLQSTGIDFEARAFEKPSDHCPIWACFLLAE